jgi:uncharacterized membrane protein
MSVSPVKRFSKEDEKVIINAIREAEKRTTGEIRVHLATRIKTNALDDAVKVFGMLGMHKTARRNGVLFFVSLSEKQFAILGDEGINKVVPDGFWNDISILMRQHFKEGRLSQGLAEGIKMAGGQLKMFFPYNQDDKNELDDSISYQ